MAKGGKRSGSGRKKGGTDSEMLKRKIQAHFSDKEVKQLILDAKAMAKKRPEIMKFLLEQIFGKAPQRVEMSGLDGEPIVLKWED